MVTQTLTGYRLSPQQKHLWLLQQDSFAYGAQCVIRIEGKLEVAILKAALQKIVARHEILRTVFQRRPGVKIPIQVISDRATISWNQVNLSNLTPQEQSVKIEELSQDREQFIFDFEQGPLLHSSLVTLSNDRHILLIKLPSLCADSYTLKNLAKEIGQSYVDCLHGADFSEESEESEEPVQYIQFSEWQNELLEEEEAETAKAYWQDLDCQWVKLPFENKSRSSNLFTPKLIELSLAPDLVAKLEERASQYNIATELFFLACWHALLWRLTKESKIFVKAVSNGRKYEELDEVLGLLAKSLPVGCLFRENSKFGEILQQISQTFSEAEDLQEYFIESDAEADLPIGFEFEDLSDNFQTGGVEFTVEKHYVCFERFKLKLNCVKNKDGITAEFYYYPERTSDQSIQCLAEQFETLLASAAKEPETAVSELNLLSDSSRDRLIIEINYTEKNYDQYRCIHHLFEARVERNPDNVAVVFEDRQLTYRSLNDRANQLAHHLQSLGVGPEVLVAIYMERSLDIVVALLGILKAGGAYLPIDPALPVESLAFRLQDGRVPVLLTQQQLEAKVVGENTRVLALDDAIAAQTSVTNPTAETTAENLAYVLYTSGSTGTPKGVAIEHRQILNYLQGILDKLEPSEAASFATVSTFAADLGNTVIFPALCTGGCLHIISAERASDPDALADYCRRHPIDYLKIVPSHLAALVASESMASILPRQCLVLGGEAANWDLINKIQEQGPNCRILNHYGPTETTVGALTYPVNIAGANAEPSRHYAKTVPIGRPIANAQVYILDERQQPSAIGVPGELYISGAGVARGYLHRPELTEDKFISIENFQLPQANSKFNRLYKTGDLARYLPDGNIEFLGRIDNQVKIRGFRIELGEIEAVLSQYPGVGQAVVSVLTDPSGNKRLVGYLVRHNFNISLKISDLRSFCLSKLAEYMVPSAFVFLKALPLTSNGKVDRRALPAPDQIRPELEAAYVAPRTPVETKLAEIWAKLLDIERVGIEDNFFELGGHSLLITKLLARIKETFQVNLSLRVLFETPTIANLATKINPGVAAEPEPEINLPAEAVLDPSIIPDGIPYNADTSPVAIFLTGATGFLGAFLLSELLEQTSADIYCLVRADNIASASHKIQSSLKSYLLWNESHQSRIIPVLGDLSKPLLGLSEQQFNQMASKLDVIYHNGALVNFTYPYPALKAPNVLGTQEILRLASFVKVKPVHFISTTSVVDPSDRDVTIISEQSSLDNAKIPAGGYARSKWVAEKIVTIARDRGLPVCIYRPGRISGHSQTGVCNTGDHTYRMIKGCIQLESIPDEDIDLNLTPVDYASQAIVYLSRQKESLGRAFHIVNPHPFPLQDMVNYISSFGYPIEPVTYEEWRSRLMDNAEDSSDNALYPLLSIFSETAKDNQSPTAKKQFDCQNTLKGLASTEILCPPVDAKVFYSYFSYLIKTGFLNSPPAKN